MSVHIWKLIAFLKDILNKELIVGKINRRHNACLILASMQRVERFDWKKREGVRIQMPDVWIYGTYHMRFVEDDKSVHNFPARKKNIRHYFK